MQEIKEFPDGYVILGDGTDLNVIKEVVKLVGKVALINADPPYGNILKLKWDKTKTSDSEFAQWLCDWTNLWSVHALQDNAAFYVWGGTGLPGFRPFLKYLTLVEETTDLNLANLITWSKKRAYGVKHNYLYTREECAYFCKGPDIKKPRKFNIPLLEIKRGYDGFNKKYKAKSEFKRRTNVWMDITEMMQGKVHEAQKAQRVIEIPIEVHTDEGEWVVDPFAGSGTLALAARKLKRKFVVIEKDKKSFDLIVKRLT